MKSKRLKTISFVFATLIVVSIMSSCNRGVGCPNELSAGVDVIMNLLK